MNPVALVVHQIRYEQKMYWRNPLQAFFSFAFPIVFFFIFASVFGHQHDNKALGHGVKLINYYTPSILGYALMASCFTSIAMQLANRREAGILKRLRGTPLPSWALFAGIVGSSLLVAALQAVVSIVFAKVAYGAVLPGDRIAPLIAVIVIASLAFCALGIAVSSLIPNPDSGPAVINLPFFVLVFISGAYFPVTGGLAKVANFFPLRPFIQAMYRAFNPHLVGSAWDAHDLRTVAIWGAVGAFFAIRRFRWAPRRT